MPSHSIVLLDPCQQSTGITTINDEPFILKLCGDIDRPAFLSSDLDLNKRLQDTDHPLKDLHDVIAGRNVLCIGFDPDNPDFYGLANLYEKIFFKDFSHWIAVPQRQETKFQSSGRGKNIHIFPYDSLQGFIEQLLLSPGEESTSYPLRPTANGEVPVNAGSARNILPIRPRTGPLQAPLPQPKEDVTVIYADFHLQIAPDGLIRAQSEEGEKNAKISAKILNKLQEMLTQIEKPQVTEEELKKCGISLYKLIFPGEVHTLFTTTVAVARSHQKTVRIRLTIKPDALAARPWEFIYYEGGDYFLAANPNTVLSRYIDLPMPPNYVRQHKVPLHLLVIIASPLTVSPDSQNWKAIIRKALDKPLQNDLTIDFVEQASFRNITDALLRKPPDMLQFIGRGIYENGKGSLVLVNDQTGEEWPVDSQRFARIFQGFDRTLGLVSLMTYETESITPHQSLLNIAPQLVIQGVPAVVAMRYSVSASTAAIYLEEFYTSIAALKPADWAVQQARKAISIQQESDYREFAAPVLYMRAKDGNIFD